MDLLSKFQELKKQELTDQTIYHLKSTLSLSKSINDRVLSMELLMYLTDALRKRKDFEEVINLLKQEINSDYFNTKTDRLKLTDDLVRTLLLTEDYQLLESVLKNRARYITNPHQEVMQKFYLAVAYEGLHDYKLAVKYLLSIQDNISNKNLTNKYLKLAMLHLKIKKYKEAVEYYTLAKTFDPNFLNPVFKLCESDMLFYKGDYLNALSKYEDYFVITKNKHRYLDRYILINIELSRLDEAYVFYQEYKEPMKQVVSKNYRMVFYEAALKLNKILKNQNEINDLTDLINHLKPNKPILNEFDNVYELLTTSLSSQQPKEFRDILLHLFRNIHSMFPFEKIIYLQKQSGGIKLYHLAKTLLLEKQLTNSQLNGSIFETILDLELDTDLLTQTDLLTIQKSFYKTEFTKYIFINGIKREHSYDYFIVYSKELVDFDFQQKLVLISHEILKKQIRDFDTLQNLTSTQFDYLPLLSTASLGLVRIENGIVHLLNDQSKKIFQTSNEYIKFEEIQTLIEEELYLDDLLSKTKKDVTIKHTKYTWYITQSGLEIYILIDSKSSNNESNDINQLTLLENEYKLLKDLQEINPSTVLSIEIRNYVNYFKDYSFDNYLQKINVLSQAIKNISKQHLMNLYFSGYNNMYVVLKSIDKRVIKRITDDLLKLDCSFELSLSSVKVNHNISKNHLMKLRYLNSLTDDIHRYIPDNKNFRANIELSNTVLTNVKNYMVRKYLPLSYQVIKDPINQTVHLLKVNHAKNSGLIKETSLRRILKANNLECDYDKVLINTLVQELKCLEQDVQIFVDLSMKSVEELTHLKKLIKQLKSTLLENSQIVININIETLSHTEKLIKGINLLKDNSFKISLSHVTHQINVSTINLFKLTDYVLFDMHDLENDDLLYILKSIADFHTINILNPEDKTITKSLLDKYNIEFILGKTSKEYHSIDSLKE